MARGVAPQAKSTQPLFHGHDHGIDPLRGRAAADYGKTVRPVEGHGPLVAGLDVQPHETGIDERSLQFGKKQPADAMPLHVRAHIQFLQFDDLPGRYEGTVGEGEPNVLWLQVAPAGHVRSVSVVGERRVPELERLTAQLTDAFR